jgi:hypothetical protein
VQKNYIEQALKISQEKVLTQLIPYIDGLLQPADSGKIGDKLGYYETEVWENGDINAFSSHSFLISDKNGDSFISP